MSYDRLLANLSHVHVYRYLSDQWINSYMEYTIYSILYRHDIICWAISVTVYIIHSLSSNRLVNIATSIAIAIH